MPRTIPRCASVSSSWRRLLRLLPRVSWRRFNGVPQETPILPEPQVPRGLTPEREPETRLAVVSLAKGVSRGLWLVLKPTLAMLVRS